MNPNSNPILAANGFDQYSQRMAIPNDPADQQLEPTQQMQQAVTFPDVAVANNTVRIWGTGIRLKNGKGIFFAPPPQSKPLKNSDYMRMFVDPLNSPKQLGYGVLNLPMSDQLYINATGDMPSGGRAMMILKGIEAVNPGNPSDWSTHWRGTVDFWAVPILPVSSTVESSGLYNVEGAMYQNSATHKMMVYNGSAWVEAGGATHAVVASRTASSTGAQTITHYLGATPTSIEIFATNAVGQPNSSSGIWDGSSNSCAWTGGSAGSNASNAVYIDQGGNNATAIISGVTSTQFTLTWSKSGSPTGTIYLVIKSKS